MDQEKTENSSAQEDRPGSGGWTRTLQGSDQRSAGGLRDVLPSRELPGGVARQLAKSSGHGEVRPPLQGESPVCIQSVLEVTHIVGKAALAAIQGAAPMSYRPAGPVQG